jgi:predicted RNA binding protein YcfA (HicA-like mRNA interferase family)
MGTLGVVSLRELERFLAHLGCKFKGQRGSHRKYYRPRLTRPIIIATHSKDIYPQHLRVVLKALAVSEEEFLRFRQRET